MLIIQLPEYEAFNEQTNEFIKKEAKEIHLTHSLITISKWESKWHKAFLESNEKPYDEAVDYIRCMCEEQLDDSDLIRLVTTHMAEIDSYINDPMTATTFKKTQNQGVSNEFVTSELIYYWMTSLHIPYECQEWHLNRLLTLIRICVIKNQPAKKMQPNEIIRNNKALNEANKALLRTRG